MYMDPSQKRTTFPLGWCDMTERWFTYPYQVTLNGVGYGFIRVAPAGRAWRVVSNNVRVTPPVVAEAKLRTYVQQIGAQYQRDTSDMGSTGDTSDTEYILQDGQPMFFEWTGGDAGKVAYVTVSGWETVDGSGVFRAVP